MLTGVGLGPGDPELLTLKAVRALKEADHVFVPGALAGNLVRPYCNPTELEFPMSQDEEEIRRCILEHVHLIAPLAESSHVAFGIIGDPNIFSTFSRFTALFSEFYPDIPVHSIPGISSVTAVTSAINRPIAGGFIVTDGSPVRTQIRMKVRDPKKMVDELKREGYSRFYLVEKMCMEGMKVWPEDNFPDKSNYFSLVFAERT